MGYSTNPVTLLGLSATLEPLKTSDTVEWECEIGREREAAYKIREALYIAATIAPEEFPEYAQAYHRLRIRVKGPGKIGAEPKARIKSPKIPAPQPSSSFRTEPGNLQRPKISSLDEAIEALKSTAPPFTFSTEGFLPDDLHELLTISRTKNLLLFWDGTNITVKQYNPDDAFLALSEEDL
jgi:hypothetical protein